MVTKHNTSSRQHMQAKLQRARDRIASLDARIAELDGERAAEQVVVDALERELGSDAGSAKDHGIPPNAENSMGFRDLIRSVMREVNAGVSPATLAQEFTKRKIPYEGKTKLSIRLANDLSRMNATGKLRKQNGLYFLNEMN